MLEVLVDPFAAVTPLPLANAGPAAAFLKVAESGLGVDGPAVLPLLADPDAPPSSPSTVNPPRPLRRLRPSDILTVRLPTPSKTVSRAR